MPPADGSGPLDDAKSADACLLDTNPD